MAGAFSRADTCTVGGLDAAVTLLDVSEALTVTRPTLDTNAPPSQP